MVNFSKVVCLCGSTKFKDEFMLWNKIMTLQGYVVLMPGVFAHSGDEITDEQKIHLDQLHKRKIMLSDFIIVVNPNNYIGESTSNEIAFAESLGLKVFYTSDEETKGEIEI